MSFFSKKFGWFDFLVVCFLIVAFYYFSFVVFTDIKPHAEFLLDYYNSEIDFPANFLYYLLLGTFSFFSRDINLLLSVSVLLLTLFTYVKFYMVKKIFLIELNDNARSITILSVFALLLILTFSLPALTVVRKCYYLGNFSPNVWHNSTTIAVMPFVLGLFYLSINQLKSFSQNRLFVIFVLLLINAFVKPSFLFVFFVTYPIMLIMKYSLNKMFWINLIPLFLTGLVVLIEYYLIYQSNPSYSSDKSGIAIDFFMMTNKLLARGNFFLIILATLGSILLSLLFPIVFIIRNKFILKSDMMLFGVLNMVVSLIIANTLIETGPRQFHGNFMWQNTMCAFILFFVCLLNLLKLSDSFKNWKKYKLEYYVFFIHVFSTFIYFSKVYITDSIL